jgi:hypothetical protein
MNVVKDHWILTSLTAVSAAVATVHDFTDLLHVDPFFLDLATAIAVGTVAIGWGRISLHSMRTRSHSKRNQRGYGRMRFLLSAFASIFPSIVLGAIAVNEARLPVGHFAQIASPWQVCGAIRPTCQADCYEFRDPRGRLVESKCRQPADDTGYFHFRRPDWWIYSPNTVTVDCPGQDNLARDLNELVGSAPTCAAVISY